MSDVTENSGQTPAGAADATMVADLTAAAEAAADVPPELVAQSLGQYLRASWAAVRSTISASAVSVGVSPGFAVTSDTSHAPCPAP